MRYSEVAKIKAESDAEIKRIEAEANADVRRIAAEAERDAYKEIDAAIDDNILRHQAINAWDGHLPDTYVSGNTDDVLFNIPVN